MNGRTVFHLAPKGTDMADNGLLARLLRDGFQPRNPRLRIDWMTHTDERILEYLDEQGPTEPDAIADVFGKSPEYVADRCRELAGRGLLAASAGSYRLTDRGVAYLADEIGPEKLDEG